MRTEVVIDVSPEAVVNAGVNMLTVTADGVVVVAAVLLLERFGEGGYLVKVVAVAPEIGDAVNASRFVAVMTALELVLWTQSIDGRFCSSTLFSCWPMTVLDCSLPLQACKPSNHV